MVNLDLVYKLFTQEMTVGRVNGAHTAVSVFLVLTDLYPCSGYVTCVFQTTLQSSVSKGLRFGKLTQC